MAWTKDQQEAVNSLFSALLAAGVQQVTHHHLSSRGFTSAANALFISNATGIATGTVTHYAIKKHLEDNPHHIPVKGKSAHAG